MKELLDQFIALANQAAEQGVLVERVDFLAQKRLDGADRILNATMECRRCTPEPKGGAK